MDTQTVSACMQMQDCKNVTVRRLVQHAAASTMCSTTACIDATTMATAEQYRGSHDVTTPLLPAVSGGDGGFVQYGLVWQWLWGGSFLFEN